MTRKPMTSMERTLATLAHREPDRVPLFLLFASYGAREMGLSIRDYFGDPQQVIEAQLRLQKKFETDCFYTFQSAAFEMEAWGMETRFFDDGPPNSGEPLIQHAEKILQLELPDPLATAALQRVLHVTRGLAERSVGTTPIIGVVISPFSAPIMQMGFEAYLKLIYEGDPAFFKRLIDLNIEFCVKWANLQIEAGANAIAYFDPMSSSSIIPKSLFMQSGLEIAKNTLARIHGPVALHMASGANLDIALELLSLPFAILSASTHDNLAALKKITAGKVTLLGDLDGISMQHWTTETAEKQVKKSIALGAQGGGFILADNHGEIPFSTEASTLHAISAANRKWGSYPLQVDSMVLESC